MENISPELLDTILSYLDRGTLRKYATVSRRWQDTIESYTLRQVRVDTSCHATFNTVFSNRRRRRILSEVQYYALLPRYSRPRSLRYENDDEKQANNVAFTESFLAFLQILAAWEDEDGDIESFAPISLRLGAHSPSDWEPRPEGLDEKRYERSYLRFEPDSDPPTVRRITEFHDFAIGRKSGGRMLEHSSVAEIAALFPRLSIIRWFMNDDERRYPVVRQQRRHDFAQSLLKLNLIHLTRFHLRYQALDPRNHEIASGIVANHHLSPKLDELSLALFALSQSPSLVEFDLYDGPFVASPCLFWPDSLSDTADLPVWPQLKEYRIELNIVQADGEWYFDGHPNPDLREIDEDWEEQEDEEEEEEAESELDSDEEFWPPQKYSERRETLARGDYPWFEFRRTPTKHFHALMGAVARACEQMPKLQLFNLRTNNEIRGAGFVEITCDGSTSPRKWIIESAAEIDLGVPQDVIDIYDTSAGGKDTIIWKKS